MKNTAIVLTCVALIGHPVIGHGQELQRPLDGRQSVAHGDQAAVAPDLPRRLPRPIKVGELGVGGSLTVPRWVAVTHTRDYLTKNHIWPVNQYEGGVSAWPTSIVTTAINGTDRPAEVATYVLGDGEILFKVFRTIGPGDEQWLLPGTEYFDYFGRRGGNAYVGETIVVVSSEPVIVMGADYKGFDAANVSDELLEPFFVRSEASRTLDVRQFDCHVPADYAAVSLFCRFPTRQP